VNVVDIVVIAILLLSALLAFIRGFTTEVLSLAGWVGAALIAIYAYPYVEPKVQEVLQDKLDISSPLIVDGLTVGVVFLVCLFVLTFLFTQIGGLIRGSSLSALDRSLGFLFGLLRGSLLVIIAFLFVTWLIPPSEQPDWMKDAKTRPYIEQGAAIFLSLLPQRIYDATVGKDPKAIDTDLPRLDPRLLFQRLRAPEPMQRDARAVGMIPVDLSTTSAAFGSLLRSDI